jgi:hypothetical protein
MSSITLLLISGNRFNTARVALPYSRGWLAVETTDMRCGLDRLAERVRAGIGQDPVSEEYFPGHFKRTHHVRKKYACAACDMLNMVIQPRFNVTAAQSVTINERPSKKGNQNGT